MSQKGRRRNHKRAGNFASAVFGKIIRISRRRRRRRRRRSMSQPLSLQICRWVVRSVDGRRDDDDGRLTDYPSSTVASSLRFHPYARHRWRGSNRSAADTEMPTQKIILSINFSFFSRFRFHSYAAMADICSIQLFRPDRRVCSASKSAAIRRRGAAPARGRVPSSA